MNEKQDCGCEAHDPSNFYPCSQNLSCQGHGEYGNKMELLNKLQKTREAGLSMRIFPQKHYKRYNPICLWVLSIWMTTAKILAAAVISHSLIYGDLRRASMSQILLIQN